MTTISLQAIKDALRDAFADAVVSASDDSLKHANHHEMAQASCNEHALTHVHVTIRSESLMHDSIRLRYQKVQEVLNPFYREGLHSISIRIMPFAQVPHCSYFH